MVVCCIQSGNTPLHHACERGSKEVALLLIEHGADVKANDKVGVVTDDTYILHYIFRRYYYCYYKSLLLMQ